MREGEREPVLPTVMPPGTEGQQGPAFANNYPEERLTGWVPGVAEGAIDAAP